MKTLDPDQLASDKIIRTVFYSDKNACFNTTTTCRMLQVNNIKIKEECSRT